MANEAPGQHPLSLKVMRVSRPSLAAHWQPFFSSSPSFSQHATMNPLSLQGAEPLNGHPKTLRDLTHAGQMLQLPAAFGAIQLGETFSCVLSVNNEAGVPVDAVRVRVEMQTSSNKVLLAEVVAPDGDVSQTLSAAAALETVVNHEVKELGQHVLACIVTYRTPPGMRPATSGGENADDPFMQTFRKFYKFHVTNPLSVKTKVHTPRSPSALVSEVEREKLFLEVHIQNLTQGPLWFEKIRLEAVEGWSVVDVNTRTSDAKDASIDNKFYEDMTTIASQEMRQYIYILLPKKLVGASKVHVPPVPGSTIPLGRLDISWRSSMGEPGRLLTSVLSRRIPLPPPPPPASSAVAPASALPPYLQKATTPGQPRPRSPSLQQQQRVGSPPIVRPGSPLRRAPTPGQSSHAIGPAAQQLPPLPVPSRADVEVDLVLLESPNDATVNLEQPFTLCFGLAVSAILPVQGQGAYRQELRSASIVLAIQHTRPTPSALRADTEPDVAYRTGPARTLKKRTSTVMSFDTVGSRAGAVTPPSRSGSVDVVTPRRILSPPPESTGSYGHITPSGEQMPASPGSIVAPRAIGVTGLTERLRRVALSEALGLQTETNSDAAFGDEGGGDAQGPILPLPYSATIAKKEAELAKNGSCTGDITFLGPSLIKLSPITLVPLAGSPADSSVRGEGYVEVTMTFIARSRGFARVGGLRVLLLDDRRDGIDSTEGGDDVTLAGYGGRKEAKIIREWDVVTEMWVH